MLDDLYAAFRNLELRPVTIDIRLALRSLVDDVESLLDDLEDVTFTVASLAALRVALDAAKAELAVPTGADLRPLYDALASAFVALEIAVDLAFHQARANLSVHIATAAKLLVAPENTYTALALDALTVAQAAARLVFDKEGPAATVHEMNTAAEALMRAIENMELTHPEDPTDPDDAQLQLARLNLMAHIDIAQQRLNAQQGYTILSISVLTASLNNARALLAKDDPAVATIAELNEAAENLRHAIGNLQPATITVPGGGGGGGAAAAPETFTVTFNTLGGSAVPNQTIIRGNRAADPAAPTRTGHEFSGWFTDEAANQRFDFATAITANITLFAGWTVPTPPTVPMFPQDEPTAWAREEILEAMERNLVLQDLIMNFTDGMTRIDFCRNVIHLIEVMSGTGIDAFLAEHDLALAPGFNDTNNASIRAATALGIVRGTGGNNFTPNRIISRAEAAVMLANTARALGIDISGAQQTAYADQAQIPEWAIEAVNYMRQIEVMIGGAANSFGPSNPYTIEQAIVTFWRFYVAMEDLLPGADTDRLN